MKYRLRTTIRIYLPAPEDAEGLPPRSPAEHAQELQDSLLADEGLSVSDLLEQYPHTISVEAVL